MDLGVLRRIGGAGMVCWGTKSAFSDTKEALKGPERGFGVVRGFCIITVLQHVVGISWDSTDTGIPQSSSVKGPEGTAGSSISEVYAGHQEKVLHTEGGQAPPG